MKRACKIIYKQEDDYKRVPSDKNIKLNTDESNIFLIGYPIF